MRRIDWYTPTGSTTTERLIRQNTFDYKHKFERQSSGYKKSSHELILNGAKEPLLIRRSFSTDTMLHKR